jgi:hypothetical protein
MIQKDKSVPENERIEKSDFIIDFEERDRLVSEVDSETNMKRGIIQSSNLKKTKIFEHLKVT